jgi:16S rRNA (uracil1498-N3)-methyltransferase
MATRLLVSSRLGNGREVQVEGEQAHYLGRVLRLKVGDVVDLFNGDDGEWRARIVAIARGSAVLLPFEQQHRQVESPLRTHLVQGISRGERMDFVVQKATELGVKRITPVITAHGMVKLDPERADKRRAHWQGIAASASEQSGRIRPPIVDLPLPLNDWLGGGDGAESTQLVLAPGAAESLAGVGGIDEKLCLLIGPEGGLSDRELEDAALAGFRAVSLGPRILRTETAALAALAIAQATWGDLC